MKALQDLLQVHHVPGNELSNREPDDIGGLVDVSGDDASYLGTCQAVGLGAGLSLGAPPNPRRTPGGRRRTGTRRRTPARSVCHRLPLRPDHAEVDIEGCLVGVGHRNLPCPGAGRDSKKPVMISAGQSGPLYGTSRNLLVHGVHVRVSLLSTLGERTHFHDAG